MRALLILAFTPVIGFNFWLVGGQLVNLVHAALDGEPTGWIITKAILGSTLGMIFLVRLMIALERIRPAPPA